MTYQPDTVFKTGTCSWCEEDGKIFADNSRCESCDGNVHHCAICRTDYHSDDLCRHLFVNEYLELRGSGTRECHDDVKESFFNLLGRLPDRFAVDLRKAIRSGRFHTWHIAPLIGGGGLLQLHGTRDIHRWGDALVDLGEGEHAEKTAAGFWWLASLYNRKTLTANNATAAWIGEWLAAKRAPPKHSRPARVET